MSTYYCKVPGEADTTDYPGVRVDASNELQAAQTYRTLAGLQPGARIRVVLDGPNYIFFADVNAGQPVTTIGNRPPVPPIGT